MDMWFCMKLAKVAKRAKSAYNDSCAKVTEVGKVPQDHTNLVKDKEALKRQVKATEDKLTKMRGQLKATVAATKDAETAKGTVSVDQDRGCSEGGG
ncbi:unnamed protein product [Prunus brigantina]